MVALVLDPASGDKDTRRSAVSLIVEGVDEADARVAVSTIYGSRANSVQLHPTTGVTYYVVSARRL
jgi:hypothetical protein